MKFSLSLASLCYTTVLVAAPVDSAVLIEYKKTGDYSAGSGTVVASENGKSLILSCAHVLPDDKGEITVTIGGKAHKAKYIAGSKMVNVMSPDGRTFQIVDGVDLALVEVDVKLPVAPVGTDAPKKGDVVQHWGFAGGPPFAENGPYHKIGKVIEAEEVMVTADARPGDSGCGLFNSKGQLIGVVHSRSHNRDEPAGYAVPLVEVRKFLADNSGGFPVFKKTLTK